MRRFDYVFGKPAASLDIAAPDTPEFQLERPLNLAFRSETDAESSE
jgi:hypothetical protein